MEWVASNFIAMYVASLQFVHLCFIVIITPFLNFKTFIYF